MIDRAHDLPLNRQARALGISRGSVYHLPRAASSADLALLRTIDALHLEYLFAGSRMLQGLLLADGHVAGHLHVATLMKRMGIEALYRRPNTSKPAPGHKIFPYLLRKLPVTRPNQAGAMDITYVPMARVFVYLTAVVDWFSRKVLAWRLSITTDVAFCIEAVEEAMARFGNPDIFNTDQGSQFTSREFAALLIGSGIKISMDGKGAWRDNVFVERIWKSVKYEELYLRAYASVSDARASSGRYLAFDNGRRPHQGLGRQTLVRPTSTRCSQSRLRYNQGRNPLSDSPQAAQTNRASSLSAPDSHLLFADEIGLPAVAHMLETMAPGAQALAWLERQTAADRMEIATAAALELVWVERDGRPAGPSALLSTVSQTSPSRPDAVARA